MDTLTTAPVAPVAPVASTAAILPPKYTIIYHGNCIDGWMAAYIAASQLSIADPAIQMYPISPNQSYTWPKPHTLKGRHVMMLDVSVPLKTRQIWFAAGMLSFHCIDHHPSAITHWNPATCPINTTQCAALQAWRYFYPHLMIPQWLYIVDRIDRWDNPSYDDRCIREILNTIAHMPVDNKLPEAFAATQRFINDFDVPDAISAMILHGKTILDAKDAALINILRNGSFIILDEEMCHRWALPHTWIAQHLYIINTTALTIDSTEAAHLVFKTYPNTHIFINYRIKTYSNRAPNTHNTHNTHNAHNAHDIDMTGAHLKQQESQHTTSYIYSARSTGFDLTTAPFLKGHPTACGAALVSPSVPPFII